MAKKKKNQRVPEVLWRLFRHKARTLLESLAALLPGRDDPVSFLLSKDDPSDYRKLLTQSYVVVSDLAPPFRPYESRFSSQSLIVRVTIETLLRDPSTSSNVVCSGYHKDRSSSAIAEILSCPSWVHLLSRVGEAIVAFLLKYTSIFLPLPRKKLHQISGPPVSQLCYKLLQHTSNYEDQHLLFPHGPGAKRKQATLVNAQSKRCKIIAISDCDSHQDSGSWFESGISAASVTQPLAIAKQCRKKYQQISSCETSISTGSTCLRDSETGGILTDQALTTLEPKKRAREFSWQRRKKRRQFKSQEPNGDHYTNMTNSDIGSSGTPVHFGSNGSVNNNPDQKILSPCSCCLLLQASQDVIRMPQIDRQTIFYKSEHSQSAFPRNHALNTLKPNLTGATSLFKEIFGVSFLDVSPQVAECCHKEDSCLIRCACLFHSLVKKLKILIHRAQCCQHLTLLDRHCAVPFFDQTMAEKACSKFEGNRSVLESGEKMLADSQLDGHLQATKFPDPVDAHCKTELRPVDSQDEHFKSFCSKSQVVSFIWAASRSIIPEELLGTAFNWRILRSNISKFIRLRRFEKITLRQCMHKLRTSEFVFLFNKHNSCFFNSHVNGDPIAHDRRRNSRNDVSYTVKQKLLKHWIYWYFSSIVVPLVQSNFYVTESEHGKQDIFYYRKPVWDKITERAVTCMMDGRFSHLDEVSTRNVISKRTFGFSKLRLCPKENGLRLLANLRASSRMPLQRAFSHDLLRNRRARRQVKREDFRYFKPVNYVLRDLHAVMKGLQLKEQEKLGSSVFDYNDVYKKLFPFLTSLKSRSAIMPSVYIVVADVVKAFDSVDQDKLLNVMKSVIVEKEYPVRRSSQVICTKKSLRIHESLVSTHHSISWRITKSRSAVFSCSLQSILVNQEWSRSVSQEQLFSILKEHLKHNILQLDRKFYMQKIGIPQGSILSALLCSYYYGHLEKNVIYPFLEKALEAAPQPASGSTKVQRYDTSGDSRAQHDIMSSSSEYILLRFIDDFIFISTSKKQAASFFTRLQRGFRDYNCYMNKEKFCLNFDTDGKSRLTSNRVHLGEDGFSFLRWSGLLINCRTLEIQADYTRYLNNHLSSTLTICWQDKPGRQLKDKLCDYMRPKCHPMLYDLNINSGSVVKLNIYQAFLLCAMKFHCYVRELTDICRLHAGSYLTMIERSFRYMYRLIKKRMRAMHLGPNLRPILKVKKEEVEWLGLGAYIRVLKRKQSRHRELLNMLRSKLAAHKITGNSTCELAYAVDDSHSSLLWKIKY